jgi:hypothetical protein
MARRVSPRSSRPSSPARRRDFSCDPSVLADVRGLLIFLNPGSYEIDEVKAA